MESKKVTDSYMTNFEDLVFQELQLQNKNEKFLRNVPVTGFALYPDIFAPEGIGSLELIGETVIEIKKKLFYSNIESIYNYYDVQGEFYNVLVVYNESTLYELPSKVIENGNHKKLMIISYDELRSHSKEKLEEQDRKNDDSRKKIEINNNISWTEQRKKIILKAKEDVLQNCNALFLGAGVSSSANMPSWNTLLKDLLSEATFLGDTLQAFKELGTHVYAECQDSNLIMARYIETLIHINNKDSNFPSIVRKHLYDGKEHTSDLLESIALIAKKGKANEIITYNFDDLVEKALKNDGLTVGKDFTSISKDAEIKDHNTLPIYHVHGILPEKGPVDDIVFSESTFHDRYQNVYHWSNVEQLHALTRKHCFFIGLSMSDPNLRRLMEIARKINSTNEIPHYAFLRRTKLNDYCIADVSATCKYVHISDSLIDKTKQKQIYNVNYKVLEEIFRDLGVNVIWYEDYQELPNLIKQVFGLYYNSKKSSTLLEIAKGKIEKIKFYEDECAKKKDNKEYPMEAFSYAAKNVEDYRNLINEVSEIFNELYTRVAEHKELFSRFITINPPDFSHLNGIADFYNKQYETFLSIFTSQETN